jgi:phospholipid/cholesterol/gamma-HCH transport system substrate-binding protein
METKVNYAIVGAFVLVLLSAMIVSIIWLSAGFAEVDNTTYKVYMEESVSGLNIESPVEFNGVGVGSVSKIYLDKTNPHHVILHLAIRSRTPISQGTRATLNIRGLTGNAYIALRDKGDDLRPLIIKKDERYPVILTSPSLLFRLDGALNELVTDLHQVSTSVNALLGPTNQQSIQKTLANLKAITDAFAGNQQYIKTIFKNSKTASQELPSLFQSGNRALYNLEHTSDNISSLSNEIKNNPSVLIRGKAQPQLGPGEK